jgi:hypothetical protein
MVSSNVMLFKTSPQVGCRAGFFEIALLLMVTFVGFGGAVSAFGANTYYVSKSAGSDSNSGTTKGSAWAHMPGMKSYTGSHTPVAGDSFILMGCDVWGNSDFPVNWQWSGSSGSQIYVGVDQTWYNTTNCPSNWNRPVWNAQGTTIGGGNYFLFPSNSATDINYVEFQSIEMTNFVASSGFRAVNNLGASSHNWTFDDIYIHGWNDSSDDCVLFSGPYSAGPTPTANNIVYNRLVVDGSDATGGSGSAGACYAFYYDQTGSKVTNSVIRYVVNPFVVGAESPGLEITGNLIEYILTSTGSNHCNMIETNGGTGPFYIHDNVMRDFECGGGETMWVANSAHEVDYVWNNVIYNLNSAQTVNAGENASGMSVYYWNNTVVPPSGSNCLTPASGRTPSGMTVYGQNNHCITTASNAIDPSFSSYGTLVSSYNLLQTPTQADADVSSHFDQYTSSQTYSNSPVASTNSTVGQGTNLASLWPVGYSTNDSQYGVTEQTINGVVQAVVGRATNTRSGAWDIGAYEFNTQDASPNAPTGLTATVQ